MYVCECKASLRWGIIRIYLYCVGDFHYRMDAVSEVLCKEVCLEFTRSHNRILFDKTVMSQPDLFPFVTLPEPEPEVVPETG